jgi:hypothetical protein
VDVKVVGRKRRKGQQAETKVGDVHSSEKSTDTLEECLRG